MEASSSPWMGRTDAAMSGGLGRWLARLTGLLVMGLAASFLARRVSGGFMRELHGGELLFLTIMMVGSISGLRQVRPRGSLTPAQRRREIVGQLIPSAAGVLIALAVSSPESPLWAVVLLWAALAIEETWYWSGQAVRRSTGPTSPEAVSPGDVIRQGWRNSPHVVVVRESAAVTAENEVASTDDEEEADEFPPDRLQQLTRFRDEDGVEAIHGVLRAEFAVGQRVHHLHVAFCPPLPAMPELTFEQIDGPEATITLGQVESYGARLDVRLARPAQEGESVVVEFYARGAV